MCLREKILVRDSSFLLNISMTYWGRVLPMGKTVPGAALQVTRWRPGHTWCSRRSHRRT